MVAAPFLNRNHMHTHTATADSFRVPVYRCGQRDCAGAGLDGLLWMSREIAGRKNCVALDLLGWIAGV